LIWRPSTLCARRSSTPSIDDDTLVNSLSLRDGMDLILDIEANYPVNEWRTASVRLWPAVRVRLGQALFLTSAQANHQPQQASWASILRRGTRAASEWRPAAARLPDVGDVDALFLSDGVSRSSGSMGAFDRWCEAFVHELTARGRRAEVLVPRWWGSGPLAPGARRIHSWVALALARSRLARKVSLDLPEYQRVSTKLESAGLVGALPSIDTTTFLGNAIETLAEGFARVFGRARPLIAPVVEYYSLPGMSFVLAARRCGVPSADIQHGVQGELHPAYGRWSIVPSDGYELLPDFFLVWGRSEADQIDSWAAGTPHRPVVGGDPLITLWRSGAFGDRDVWLERLREIVSRSPRSGLVTLNAYETEDDLLCLIRSLVRAGSGWTWLVRCHPTLDTRALVRRVCGRLAVTNVEVDLATSAPLPALLELVDLHVSAYSSVVEDAARAGVPSIVTHEAGALVFAQTIEDGVATFTPISDAETFGTTANEIAGRAQDARRDASDGLSWMMQMVEHR
jgi:hypothetical protein